VPPIGPAVANAWAALTGQTVRRLPFRRALADLVDAWIETGAVCPD